MPHAQAVPGRVAFAVAGAEHSLPALGMVGLAELLGPILDTWRLRATVKGLRYVPTTLRVRSHATLLATLLGNLLGNAVKYTEHGSVLIGRRRPARSGAGGDHRQRHRHGPRQPASNCSSRSARPTRTAKASAWNCGSCAAAPRRWAAACSCAAAQAGAAASP